MKYITVKGSYKHYKNNSDSAQTQECGADKSDLHELHLSVAGILRLRLKQFGSHFIHHAVA